MPTSPISKRSAVKKNLPVKWRDSAWSPRIVIRSLNRPPPARIYWDAPGSDWDLGPGKVPFPSTPRWGRAGGRRRLFDSILPSSGGLSRLVPTSRLDNLL